MNLLAYWKYNNYEKNTRDGRFFSFNSNQERLHTAIELGERLWLVTGQHQKGLSQYKLVANLLIEEKSFNSPDYEYGKYRLIANKSNSFYYLVDGPDVSELLLQLKFETGNQIASKAVIGQSLQTIRALIKSDVFLLDEWASNLSLDPRVNQSELET